MPSTAVPPTGKPANISRLVLIAAIVVVLVVLGMTGIEVWRQRATTLRTAEKQLSSLSLALAHQTGSIFTAVDLALIHSSRNAFGNATLAMLTSQEVREELAERTIGLPFLAELKIADASGTVINSSHPLPGPPEQLGQFDYFQIHRTAGRGTQLGLPSWSTVHDRWVIPVSRRIESPGDALVGVMVGLVDISYLQGIYRHVVPADGGAFALYRTDAYLLTRFPHIEEAVGQPFGQLALFEKTIASPRGTYRVARALDGQPRLLSYTLLDDQPLVLTVSVDEELLLASWRGNAVRLALGALLATTLLAAAFATVVRQLRAQEIQSAALRASEVSRRFAQFAVDHAADMALWVDRAGRIRYANQAACWHFGWPSDELPEVGLAEVDQHVAAEGWDKLLETLRAETYLRYESQLSTRAGTVFPAEVSANYVVFEGESYVCAFVRDITERRAAETALSEKTAHLEASNAELEQFAYVCSHDLREPLRMVNSYVGMLGRRYADKLDADAQEFIAFARDGATRMDRLILDLLEYSRVGRIERPMVPLPLAGPVEIAVRNLAVAAEECGAAITVAPDLPTVSGNEEELLRLFLNVLGNALKYRHPDRPPAIGVAAERHGDEVLVSVSDNGIGIAPQYFERVFRIFQRLHSREQYEGTGIGLAICKKIVERHGGRIWVESVPDQGSTFHFTLKAA